MFTKATKTNVAPKIAFQGVSGAGKTFSALRFARGYTDGKIALIDTENGSASIYADCFEFDVCNISPRTFGASRQFWWTDFRDAIDAAKDYDFVILDSASHLWQGVLDYKSRLDDGGGNSFTNWNKAGQQYSTVINMILQSPIPFICCFRSKTEYALQTGDGGKVVPVKLGLAPIARDGIDYEFTLALDINRDHSYTVSKSRIPLPESRIIDEELGRQVKNYFNGEVK